MGRALLAHLERTAADLGFRVCCLKLGTANFRSRRACATRSIFVSWLAFAMRGLAAWWMEKGRPVVKITWTPAADVIRAAVLQRA